MKKIFLTGLLLSIGVHAAEICSVIKGSQWIRVENNETVYCDHEIRCTDQSMIEKLLNLNNAVIPTREGKNLKYWIRYGDLITVKKELFSEFYNQTVCGGEFVKTN